MICFNRLCQIFDIPADVADFRDSLDRWNIPIEGRLFESESEKKGGDK
jgi:hypothetical protein